MNFIPLNDNMLLTVSDAPTQTKSGLYLTNASQETVLEGRVVSVRKESEVLLGSLVWFAKFNSTQVTVDGEKYYVVSEKSALGFAVEEVK